MYGPYPGCKAKDIDIGEMFREMYHNAFYEEVHLSARDVLRDMGDILSRDDKMFLVIVEKDTKKVYEHYEVPLPYRDKNLQLSNNKDQAIRRMQRLKKRFQRDPEFFNNYTKQIEELISKGYVHWLSSS